MHTPPDIGPSSRSPHLSPFIPADAEIQSLIDCAASDLGKGRTRFRGDERGGDRGKPDNAGKPWRRAIMNYRHAFHAGNFADVVKHAVLSRILVHLCGKPAPYRVIDTHAGAGRYDLLGPEATRSGEWRDGIGRLFGAHIEAAAQPLLAPYLAAVAACNPAGQLGAYPGSPAIAAGFLRAQDRLVACELEPGAAATLARHLGHDRRIKIIALDGWTALNAYVPPKERRGLVSGIRSSSASRAKRWRGSCGAPASRGSCAPSSASARRKIRSRIPRDSPAAGWSWSIRLGRSIMSSGSCCRHWLRSCAVRTKAAPGCNGSPASISSPLFHKAELV